MTKPVLIMEVRVLQEIHRALKAHGANPAFLADVRRRKSRDSQLISMAYDTLERLGANRWLLAAIGSWQDGASDEETYQSLKALNEGRFAIDITASTSREA
ncbi:MAG TPA: hypothetical protein VKE95_05660 [Burkholderiales bacterium]|nr:hypothetical protein [Burkholderiales bacterium]